VGKARLRAALPSDELRPSGPIAITNMSGATIHGGNGGTASLN
jgi:hypothetical protein